MSFKIKSIKTQNNAQNPFLVKTIVECNRTTNQGSIDILLERIVEKKYNNDTLHFDETVHYFELQGDGFVPLTTKENLNTATGIFIQADFMGDTE